MHFGCKVQTYESGIAQPYLMVSAVILAAAVAATLKVERPMPAQKSTSD